MKLCGSLLFLRDFARDQVFSSVCMWLNLVFRGARARLTQWLFDCWSRWHIDLPDLTDIGDYSCLYFSIMRNCVAFALVKIEAVSLVLFGVGIGHHCCIYMLLGSLHVLLCV